MALFSAEGKSDMGLSLNKNVMVAYAYTFALVSFSNCHVSSKQEEAPPISTEAKIETIGKGVLSAPEVAGTWSMTIETENGKEAGELSFIPAGPSYLCRAAHCFLVQEKNGQLIKKKQVLVWPAINVMM